MTNGNDIHPTERVSGSGPANDSGPDGNPTQKETHGKEAAQEECIYCRRPVAETDALCNYCRRPTTREENRETQEGISSR